MGKSFRKINLCHTNDFDASKNDKIKLWVERAGGTFSKSLTPDVTHLVCSEGAWKHYLPIVRQARRQRHVKIVNFDWLEDSLMSSSKAPKDTKPYEWEGRKKNKQKKDIERKSQKDKDVANALLEFEKGCIEFERDTDQNDYHLYQDPDHFTYSITLVRSDILNNRNQYHHIKVRYASQFSAASNACPVPLYYFPKPNPLSLWPVIPVSLPRKLSRRFNRRLRVPIMNPAAQTIQMYESHSRPHRYAVYTRYSEIGKLGTASIAPIGSTFDFAMQQFKWYFKQKTGVSWEQRLEPNLQHCASANTDGGSDTRFVYKPPPVGKPRGLMPGKTRMERSKEGDVTVVIPSVEIDDTELDCQAKTPQAGW